MPITKTIQLFKFDELSDIAKERARQWFRECLDSSDFENVISDAVECARILGVTFDEREYKTVGGHTRHEPAIWWSGFSSQGDGASFDGSYRYARDSVRQIKKHAPQDTTLHAIAQALARVQKRNFYKLCATCKHSGGPYMHSGWMSVDTFRTDDRDSAREEDGNAVREALRHFADWIYKQLREEDQYLNSDEHVDESIEGNEYTFTADGKRENP
jgi:hypothetical protein